MTASGVQHLCKRYGGVAALDDVSMSVGGGEVRALLGQNGAGKSTLIGCLGGRIAPDSGTIRIADFSYRELSPRQSLSAGVAVIYQHLSLIDSLSVADNIFLGDEKVRGGLIEKRRQHEIARQLLDRIGASCSPAQTVAELSMGQRQLVEIAKALRREAKLLILDEPTAALSQAEARALENHVQTLRSEGIAIIYVTHLLNEVSRLADSVTVMRNGGVVLDARSGAVSRRELVEAITGRPVDVTRAPRTSSESSNPPGLELDRLTGRRFGPVSLRVRQGEIVGIFGAMGSGKTSLLETIAKTRSARGGRVAVNQRTSHRKGPAGGIRDGIAFVPADRQHDGLFATLSASDNSLIAACGRLSRGPMRSFARERDLYREVTSRLAIRPTDPHLPVDRFSGGNQQKILLGRWVNSSSNVKVLLLDDPTQGVDVGARQEIYGVVRDLAHRSDLAVLFATSEPEELLQLADRAFLMRDGQLGELLDLDGINEEGLANLLHDRTPATQKETM